MKKTHVLHAFRGTMIGLAILLTICFAASSSFADVIPAAGDPNTGIDPLPSGTQAFIDFGTTLADGSPTGNINTATSFTFGDMLSNNNNTGDLVGMPSQMFGPETFTVTNTGASFGNAVFGTFSSTQLTEYTDSASAGIVGIAWAGFWTPGTYALSLGVAPGRYLSDFRLAFSQTPATTGSISGSATFSTPSVIPEPAMWPVLGIGFGGLAGLVYRRRKPAATA